MKTFILTFATIMIFLVLFLDRQEKEPFVTVESFENEVAGPTKATIRIKTDADEISIKAEAKNSQEIILRKGTKGEYYQVSSSGSNPRYEGIPVKVLLPHPLDVKLDRYEDSWKNIVQFDAVLPPGWTYVDKDGEKEGVKITVTEKGGSSRSVEIIMTTNLVMIGYR